MTVLKPSTGTAENLIMSDIKSIAVIIPSPAMYPNKVTHGVSQEDLI